MAKVSMITPTFNERENIPKLVHEIFNIIEQQPEIDLELIVVDDNSPDGTGNVAEELSQKFPIKVIHRKGKMGLGSAVMEGFAVSQRDIVGVMDADLSHDPVIIPDMIEALRENDIVIGSRFNAESTVENWRLDRKLLSVTGVWLARKLTKTADPLSGFFVLHKRVLSNVRLTSPGYKILLEILVKGNYRRTREIPFKFRTREHSVSKLNTTEYFLFLKQLFVFSLRKAGLKFSS